jgi:hypothetical protein
MKNKFESNSGEETVAEGGRAEQVGIESQEASRRITFPHGEAALKLYEKEYGSDPKELKEVRDIFEAFFNQEVANIKVYNSEKFGAAFPYTRIDMSNFAKALYEKYTGAKAEIKLSENGGAIAEGEQKRIDREFIFGSFLALTNGNPFTFVEEAMHQCVERLPAALEKLKNGEEPDAFEIFTLGSPTNEFGTMSAEFFENFKKEPIAELGNIYSEFIQKNGIKKDNPDDKLNLELFGISMGGGMAAITGEKLLETNDFTQDREQSIKEKLSHVVIRSEVPVSLGRSKIKPFQIPVGFITDSIVGLVNNPYGRTVAFAEPNFMKQLNVVLAEQGIHKNMTKDQEKMKSASIHTLMLALGKGLTLKPETKVNEIYGLKDLTTYTPSLAKEAKEQMESHSGALGQNLVHPQRENSRVFAVKQSHVRPFFRPRELKRIRKAAMELDSLENGGK